MSERPPAIVVSLSARSTGAAADEILAARRAGADLAEVRVDRWPAEEVARIDRLFPSQLPLLATYRSSAEGGSGASEPAERRTILLRLAALPFRWIDLEYDRDLPLLPELPPAARLGRIVSSHASERSATDWDRRLQALAGVDAVGKLVVPASVRELYRELLPRLPPPEEGALVVHTTGASGPILRALSRRLGFPFVFAAPPGEATRDAVEPSQIPVDCLRPFLDADGMPPLFAVVGRPVARSRSPGLHAAWMRTAGARGLYVALEMGGEDEFLESLPDLASSGFRGVNVTHPFKSAALEAATDVAPGAAACAAANCLTFREGRVEGENTDLVAILRRLEELRALGRWTDRSLTVVGAGGAARATLEAAVTLDAEIAVVARRTEVARALGRDFGATVLEPGEARSASLVVQATPAGHPEAGPLAVPLAPLLRRGSHLLDWVYATEDPGVARAAEVAGATYEDGWRLLVYQAAASYAIWWGREPGEESLRAALREGGCAA
jgi:shikimate dehydrogenase